MIKIRKKIFWLISGFTLVLLLSYFAQPYRVLLVRGDSMFPVLEDGSWMLVDTKAYRDRPINSGDIVILEHQGQRMVKRIFAGPGEEVVLLRPSGTSALPVQQERMSFALQLCSRDAKVKLERSFVPQKHYFCLGDNLAFSLDSRDFGAVSDSEIRGKVLRTLR